MIHTDAVNERNPSAHWIGIIVGLAFGLFQFHSGVKASFTFSPNFNELQTFLTFLYSFSLLPCTILGLFKPRLASWLIAAYLVLLLIGTCIYFMRDGSGKIGFVSFFFLVMLPPLAVSAAFAYSTSDKTSPIHAKSVPTPHLPVANIQGKSRKIAIFFGLAMAFNAFPGVSASTRAFYQNGNWYLFLIGSQQFWIPIFIIGASVLSPKWAANIAFLSVVGTLAFRLLIGVDPYLLIAIAAETQLPLALIGFLLLRASKFEPTRTI